LPLFYYIIHSTLTSKSCQDPLAAQSLNPSFYGRLAMVASYALINPSEAEILGSTEDMLHSPIDVLVRYPLSLLGNKTPGLSISMDRNRMDK
jgi:hypothetical protein